MSSGPPPGHFHCYPRRYQYWAVVPQIQVQIVAVVAVDSPVTTQVEFQQSQFASVEVPQFQFIDRVLAVPVVTQKWVPIRSTSS